MSSFTKEQIEDLLLNVLETPKMNHWRGNKIQFCCTIHGESHPSCGIDIDYCPTGEPDLHECVFNCFACGQSGTMSWLLYKSKPETFKSVAQAEKFLRERYGITSRFLNGDNKKVLLKRYEDKFVDIETEQTDKVVKPFYTLAPYKSGKQTYQYFFDRGFDKSDMREFMIGRDLKEETVTIPIMWNDREVAGIIGRYIDPKRPPNLRYKVYEFNRSSLIYPLNKVVPVDNTLILMESCFDVIALHKWGFPNAVCTMTNKVSKKQAEQIADLCDKVIVLCDLDDRGHVLLDTAKHYLKGKCKLLIPTYHSPVGKDPCEWGEIETVKTVNSASYLGVKKLKRL